MRSNFLILNSSTLKKHCAAKFQHLWVILLIIKGMFTHTVSVSTCVTVSVKVYHCVNGNRLFDTENGFGTHSNCQTDHHYTHNVNLTETVTDMDTEMATEMGRVNRPLEYEPSPLKSA